MNSVQKSSIESSIELRIKSLLDMMNIQYTSQMKLKSSKNSLYFFDICIGDILIEINGDFWHANPNKYKKGDILKFPKKEVSSDELWLKDKIKKKDANKIGYNVVYLWESFIRKSSNEELIETLKDIIENKNYKDRNYEHIKVKS
jgi:G:T-mismatch repair DNA endonuclease (very short patch repair protein)